MKGRGKHGFACWVDAHVRFLVQGHIDTDTTIAVKTGVFSVAFPLPLPPLFPTPLYRDPLQSQPV